MKRFMLFLAIGLMLAGPAMAGSVTDTLNMSATVEPTVSVSVTAIAFGISDGISTKTANGAVAVTCTTGYSYTIKLAGGDNILTGLRRLANGANYIAYKLFKEVGLTTEWGDAGATHAGTAVSDTGNGSSQTHTVYGQLQTFGASAVGSYTDAVTVTVDF